MIGSTIPARRVSVYFGYSIREIFSIDEIEHR